MLPEVPSLVVVRADIWSCSKPPVLLLRTPPLLLPLVPLPTPLRPLETLELPLPPLLPDSELRPKLPAYQPPLARRAKRPRACLIRSRRLCR